jgi:glyceraldehyde 3-phosphate dehydrogenase
LDLPHKDLRRARAAMMSIIPTTTGAAKAIGTVIPELNGKIDGMALRVPVSDGSIADMVLTLKKEVNREEINKVLKDASEDELKGIMEYTEEPLVSSDIIGNPHSSIVDGLSTMVLANKSKTVKILSWYDNEWSFACRLIDLMKFVANMMHA